MRPDVRLTPLVDLPSSLLERIRIIALGLDTGDRFSGERSVVLNLPHPMRFSSRLVRAIKIKAVGFLDARGVWHRPRMTPWFGVHRRKYVAVSYTRSGGVVTRPGEDVPVGGELLRRVRAECTTTGKALAVGLPACVSLGYGEYLNRTYRGQRTGFIMLGIADPLDRRIGKLWWDRHQSIQQAGAPPQRCRSFAKKMARDARRLGRMLRRVHRAGFLNYCARLANFGVYRDKIVVHDLASARTAEGLNEVQCCGHRLRDLYTLASSVSIWSYHPSYRKYSREVIRALLDGYFGSRTNRAGFGISDVLRFKCLLEGRHNLKELPPALLDAMRVPEPPPTGSWPGRCS